MNDIIGVAVDALALGGIYALLSVGFSVILQATGVAQFGAGANAYIGAYAFVSLSRHVSPWIALLIILLIGAALGILLYFILMVMGHRLGGTSTSISLSAFAVGLAIAAAIDLHTGGVSQSANPLIGGHVHLGGSTVLWQSLIMTVIAAGALILIYCLVSRTMLGKAMTAVSQAPDVARAIGLRLNRVVLWSWIIATVPMVLAGALLTPIVAVSSNEALSMALYGFTGAIIGGITRPGSAALGAILLSAFAEPFSRYVSSEMVDLATFSVLFVVMAVRPSGILSSPKRRLA